MLKNENNARGTIAKLTNGKASNSLAELNRNQNPQGSPGQDGQSNLGEVVSGNRLVASPSFTSIHRRSSPSPQSPLTPPNNNMKGSVLNRKMQEKQGGQGI